MKSAYINPFVQAGSAVLEMILAHAPGKLSLSMQPSTFTSEQCNVAVGVTGQVQGHIIFGMTLQTADQIASTMLGQPIKHFDQLAASAIAELGNMIGGNALAHLSESGYTCDLTPPTIIRGANVKISTLSIPAIVIPLETRMGLFSITIGLEEKY